MSEQHTPGAVKAAKHINERQAVVFGRDTWDVDELAGLIDRETSLPTLQARIKELEKELLTLITFSADLQQRLEAEKAELLEACQASLKAFRGIYDQLEEEGDCGVLTKVKLWPLSKLRAALAKAESPEIRNPNSDDQKPQAGE